MSVTVSGNTIYTIRKTSADDPKNFLPGDPKWSSGRPRKIPAGWRGFLLYRHDKNRIMNHNKLIVKELEDLIHKGNAHASFDEAVKGVTHDKLGSVPKDLPYSIW